MRERLRLKRFRLLQVNKKFCREIVLSERIDDMKIIILFFLHRKHICLQHGVIPVTGALLLSIHFKHAFFVRIGNVAVISKFTTPQSWYNILALKDLAEQLLNIHHPFPREIIGGTLFLLFRNHISRAPRHASEFSLSVKHLVFCKCKLVHHFSYGIPPFLKGLKRINVQLQTVCVFTSFRQRRPDGKHSCIFHNSSSLRTLIRFLKYSKWFVPKIVRTILF